MSKEELKESYKKFAEEYILDWNATRAYQAAYPGCEYNTAKVNGCRLLSNIKIKEYIEEIKPNIEKEKKIKAKKIEEFNNKNNVGFIYIIQCENFHYYKIGKSVNGGKNRIKAMQTGMPFNLHLIEDIKVKEFHDIESDLHRIYKEQRVRGEWFLFTDNQLFGLRNRLKNMELKDE